jgi:hypothetical protein
MLDVHHQRWLQTACAAKNQAESWQVHNPACCFALLPLTGFLRYVPWMSNFGGVWNF